MGYLKRYILENSETGTIHHLPLLSFRRKARPLVEKDQIVSEIRALCRIPVRSAAPPLAGKSYRASVGRAADPQQLPAPAQLPRPIGHSQPGVESEKRGNAEPELCRYSKPASPRPQTSEAE